MSKKIILAVTLALYSQWSLGREDTGAIVHNIDISLDKFVTVTVESPKKRVECVVYRDKVPVGSGAAYTKANIANVRVTITEKSGALTAKCF